MVDYQEGKVAFDLSVYLVQEIYKLLIRANSYYLKANYLLAFNQLKCIKLNAIQDFKDTEREELKDMENKFKPYIIYESHKKQCEEKGEINNKTLEILQKKLYVEGDELMEMYEQYKIRLMDILDKHGYLVKKAVDHKSMF